MDSQYLYPSMHLPIDLIGYISFDLFDVFINKPPVNPIYFRPRLHNTLGSAPTGLTLNPNSEGVRVKGALQLLSKRHM